MRPDQYYTDVIARPMSGIGRKPVAGRDVEVKPKIFDVLRKRVLIKVHHPGCGGGGAAVSVATAAVFVSGLAAPAEWIYAHR